MMKVFIHAHNQCIFFAQQPKKYWEIDSFIKGGVSMKATILVEDLVKALHYEVLIGNQQALQRNILTSEVNRPGLELVGFFEYTDWERGIVFGRKELAFMERMDSKTQRRCFDALTAETIPFIVITRGLPCPSILQEIALDKNFPILKTDRITSAVITEIILYTYEKLSPQQLIHGTLVDMYGLGVLICGESGIGKSEAALELIRRGHRLVADDSVLVYAMFHRLYGKAPIHLKDYLEVRGLGVIRITRMFGMTALRDSSQIDYIIDLVPLEESKKYSRLPDQTEWKNYLGERVPSIRLPVSGGRNMADLIEVAVTALRAQASSGNATEELMAEFDKLAATGGTKDD